MKHKLLLALALCFPVFVVMGFFPVDLYSKNAQALELDVWLVHLFFMSGATICLLIFALSAFVRISRGTVSFFWGLGAFVLLADVFSPLQLTKLDGTSAGSAEPLINTLIELAIAVAIVVLLVAVRHRAGIINLFAALSAALFFAVVGIYIYAPGPPPHSQQAVKPADIKVEIAAPPRSDLPNIYQFHLDEMQSDYALAAIRELGLEPEFQGFTFFSDNISNYPYTQASIPSYLTSSIYQGGDFIEWTRSFDQGQIKDLKALGYFVEIVGLPYQLQTNQADSFRSPEDIYKEVSLLKHPTLADFMGLWLAKTMPNLVTNEALRWGQSLGVKVSSVFEQYVPADIPQTIDQGLSPFQSVISFKQMMKEEPQQSATGRYVLMQALLPHAPYTLDNHCKFRRVEVGSLKKAYKAHTLCAVSLMGEFLRELKALGRYDNSLVVVLSDHGSGWVGYETVDPMTREHKHPYRDGDPAFKGVTAFGGRLSAFEARSMASLMIKPVNSPINLTLSKIKTQLIDVYPTIMDLIGHTPGVSVAGVSLKKCLIGPCQNLEQRPQEFYVYPDAKPGVPMYKNLVNFYDGHAYFKETEELN
ncbi:MULTISPECIES: hypothetical protein [unclassified Mesorhizobium]|uniref:hypothetical protein n=1 Tax=unclassified Mesorhizobium TaxID=325217 RepID=UPI0011289216|nr:MULTISPECIES: hypothetical protein [unclassified Mesorhizobium]MBZ9699538.1 hypothetical protein [Mesorhizobium sp. CO1-1-3]MBZ9945791.1 hypothetical protein [Mesorhizobium sp. BR1-1-11]TPJ08222.1 hypothetical protein FJ428_07925 [Mesorhizobium sp. B2-8-1]